MRRHSVHTEKSLVMSRQIGVRPVPAVAWGYRAVTLVAVLAATLSFMVAPVAGAAEPERRPLTVEEGTAMAAAALQYATVEYQLAAGDEQGVPYAWGGRVEMDEFLHQAAVLDEIPETLGVDASGLVVKAVRTTVPDPYFLAFREGEVIRLQDATSAVLYNWNIVDVEPVGVQPGDLVFFRDDADEVSGVGVITARQGARIDFVVASAREGKVIQTFLRTDGEYWTERVAGLGRFLRGDAE